MITCDWCKAHKAQDQFCKSTHTKSGYQNPCKSCYNKSKRAYRAEHRDRLVREREALKGTDRLKAIHRRATIKHRYGITEDRYQDMLAEQGHACLLCGVTGVRLGVDHCHKTGAVRGLLCRTCNLGLGHFKDEVEVLNRAVEYLKRYP